MTLLTKRKRVVKRPEDRRQDILDAAVKVMAEKGIAHTTVADITGAAGVAKGTFYLYFDSKEHLLAALRQRFVDETIAKVAPFVDRIGRDDWWALTDGVVEHMVDFMLDHRETLLVFTQEPRTSDTHDILMECDRKMNELFAFGIQAGTDAGVFQVGDPMLMASFLHHALEGVILESILYGEEPERDRLIAAAGELTRKALGPSSPPA